MLLLVFLAVLCGSPMDPQLARKLAFVALVLAEKRGQVTCGEYMFRFSFYSLYVQSSIHFFFFHFHWHVCAFQKVSRILCFESHIFFVLGLLCDVNVFVCVCVPHPSLFSLPRGDIVLGGAKNVLYGIVLVISISISYLYLCSAGIPYSVFICNSHVSLFVVLSY
jgi:hypothetical protein